MSYPDNYNSSFAPDGEGNPLLDDAVFQMSCLETDYFTAVYEVAKAIKDNFHTQASLVDAIETIAQSIAEQLYESEEAAKAVAGEFSDYVDGLPNEKIITKSVLAQIEAEDAKQQAGV